MTFVGISSPDRGGVSATEASFRNPSSSAIFAIVEPVYESEGGETMKPTALASYLHTECDLPLPETPKETILASQPPGNAGNIG
jgi:hypothetical protein